MCEAIPTSQAQNGFVYYRGIFPVPYTIGTDLQF